MALRAVVPWTLPGAAPLQLNASSSAIRCDAQENPRAATVISRRKSLVGFTLAMGLAANQTAALAREVEVGAYLPPVESLPGFVQFKASGRDTPALRAGNVQPYEFILPSTWKQQRIANILSGNYCQPKCAEPWVEVKFEDDKEGSLQVVAAPMVRLTNKPNARIDEIGSPEKLIAALGPFVTGNSYDPDEVIETSVKDRDGEKFYCYTLETPYAKTGTHNLAAATSKGNVVLLFVVSASESQWSKSESVLRTILDSFKA
ncbi:hypothetical protein SELMODRAFT_176658 [Selaginella moellendorffii]|uniref:PsbP C-terminal domain-containing protein n=1 Tax=Selaginella moellendorffii TaxID=88036 RepID=D8S3X2_SELML|nr:psbP domain-containing protein 6, chloroplastic [Selaginella moellendorffii]XP_024538925.1 psbP domain-containing protein 6, chloroplastic [Selaginella moellendorffii]EFJ20658.1 hypothetical protein SELMODRAFT_176658 [Selaginella moellendorffii]|eukprot:XP_002978001.1 psbP domain-containing protein 6, chloroplastic [Selaginella moellendorffii]